MPVMAAIDRPRPSLTALHLLGLWALAVAHPLLDLLQRSPEFFVAHDAGPADIAIIVLGLVLLVPLALIVAVWVGGSYALRSAIALLVGALAIQLVKQAGIQTSPIAIPLGAAAGIAAAVAYSSVYAARSVTILSSVALIIVPVLFLTRPDIRQLMLPSRAPQGPEASAKPGAP